MSFLYCTADQIASVSGGGIVTHNEMTALADLSVEQGQEFICWDRNFLCGSTSPGEPWGWDTNASKRLLLDRGGLDTFRLAHFYAGTFTLTVDNVKRMGARISYTAAAHDIEKSRVEHIKLGLPFSYPHLDQPDLWKRYVGGYRAADVVICPSQHSAECMRSYGCQKVEVIPHGVNLPETAVPPPTRFVVGYLGAIGPDKGLIYLLQAWKKLNYTDAVLYIAGHASKSEFVDELIRNFGGGHIIQCGWLEKVDYFYSIISLYVQPSVTEGFGIEVLEAMSYGRAVLCSEGAGAADVVPETWRFPAGDVDALAEKIDQFRKADLELMGAVGRGLAREYEWPKIRSRYQKVWRGLLA